MSAESCIECVVAPLEKRYVGRAATHPTAWLIDSDSFGEDGHQLIGASGGEGFAPVVGFGVVEFVEQGDGVADGGEAAE